ncbi:Bug family tripartite tricarboxylate transporter substrate binding protein [Bradyrhizobium erythrophlei]|jgi:tripartite-type tricarboxylate transporter receptor subunit TctC|uniref:Tripartite-type tricarboxylate transporter, receptor component TctC n=1 Tax=Bradyrhizobium erythrophlei TaxID=1437360 RepID=A0A1M7T3W8_9BRAD|nr:tripartite tricarboxylate transporter substrate binding protein [Bradyrhizobium erythrophlei]SHN65419.1 Tripartite-type tricarboxylate transporter, receptor component TctC [Bradyrhizobium erythrophlei]
MRRAVLLLLLASLPAAAAHAGDFPSRTVTIVSPYQAGGTSDLVARVLAQKLGERWGKTVIVENKPGANGGTGVNAVVSAAPDGHTLLAAASSALTLNPLFYPKLNYDPVRDLTPITRTGLVANVLVINPALPVNDVKSLIGLARQKPGTLTYASQGVGSNGHVTGEFFKQRAQIDILHVPYKGSAPAVQDLLAGHVQIMFDNLPSVLPLIRAGELRALAVTTAERSPELPEVPTISEAALPGFDTSAWFALLAPKGTPVAIVQEIEHAAVTVLTDPETRERFRTAGVAVVADGSSELTKHIASETVMWRDVIAKAGIKAE